MTLQNKLDELKKAVHGGKLQVAVKPTEAELVQAVKDGEALVVIKPISKLNGRSFDIGDLVEGDEALAVIRIGKATTEEWASGYRLHRHRRKFLQNDVMPAEALLNRARTDRAKAERLVTETKSAHDHAKAILRDAVALEKRREQELEKIVDGVLPEPAVA